MTPQNVRYVEGELDDDECTLEEVREELYAWFDCDDDDEPPTTRCTRTVKVASEWEER